MYSEGAIFGETLKTSVKERIFTICFSRNLVKIYRIAILTNFFQCMRNKNQRSTHHTVVFVNHLILVVTKGHKNRHRYLTNLEDLVGGLLKHV